MKKLLVVDDDLEIRRILETILEKAGYSCAGAASVQEARGLMNENVFDLVLLDIMMPGESGLNLLEELSGSHPATAVIMVTAIDDLETAKRAMGAGVYGYVIKPFMQNELIITVANALRRRDLEIANQQYRENLEKALRDKTFALSASEIRYQALVESVDSLILRCDKNGMVTFANQAASKYAGTMNIIGAPLAGLILLKDDPKKKEMPQIIGRLVSGETDVESFQTEKPALSKNRYVAWSVRKISGGGNESPELVLVGTDITKNVITENKLKRTGQNQSALTDLLSLTLQDLTLEKLLQKAFRRLLSIQWLSIQRRGCLFLFDDETGLLKMVASENLSEEIEETCKTVSPGHCVCGKVAQLGKAIFTECLNENHAIKYDYIQPHGHYCAPIKRGDRLLGVVNFYLEHGHVKNEQEMKFIEAAANLLAGVVERKKSEMALSDRELMFRSITATAKDAIIMINSLGLITYWNPAAEQVFGYAMQEMLGKNLHETVVPERLFEKHRQGFSQFKEKGIGMAVGQTLELPAVRKDGSEIMTELSVSTVKMSGEWHAVGIVRDITNRKSMEAQLLHAQKLDSIGRLAAGIAHEINTPTQYVSDNTTFLKDSFWDLLSFFHTLEPLFSRKSTDALGEEDIKQMMAAKEDLDLDYLVKEIPLAIEQSLEGLARIASIVKAMKDFSHPGTGGKIMVDINKAIENTLLVARNEWKYQCDMVLNLDPSLPLVSALPNEINQALLNIVVNAAHAISEVVEESVDAKGAITISTKNLDKWIQIRISDTGPGIPDHIKDRIFDPFFTTKAVGKGTGQGLAITRSVVVDKHQGRLEFETEAGRGTTFVINLPVEASGD